MMQELLYTLRILAAVACGALIGWERERNGKRAGLRTHMIIAASSALMMILSKTWQILMLSLLTVSI